ncbi:DUF4328 domain-containing protein [Kitasatospora sp. NPDC057223]|uniref:DUF4328 domain-containing protein n=1 Tax=Kitasatospora sp. NPDC057223 TaxID=3346055 RepID=UPI00362E5A96
MFLGVCAALRAAVLALDGYTYGLLDDLLSGAPVPDLDVFDTVERAATVLGNVHWGAVVVTGIAFITWFHRVRANAGLFSPNGHRHSQGWAIGSWITPVLLFWVPRRMVSDSWLASTPLGPDGERQYGSHRLLNLWWLTWIASVVTTRIANAWATGGNTREIRTALGIAVASDLLELTAAGLAIALVVRLTAMQDTRAVVNPAHPPAQ